MHGEQMKSLIGLLLDGKVSFTEFRKNTSPTLDDSPGYSRMGHCNYFTILQQILSGT